MKIYSDSSEGITVIQNSFIDQYMPHANGEFVKVYLYLLRCANSDRDLSLASIADVFDHTEKDVKRALLYWEKQRLIRLCMSGDGTPVSVTFCDSIPVLSSEPEKKPASFSVHNAEQTTAAKSAEVPVYTAPVRKQPVITAPTPDRLEELLKNDDIRQLMFVAEQYMNHTLSSSEQNDLIFYYDNLKFSVELIEYLLEYCVSKGSSSRHYMQKVALAWAEEGICTVSQAKQASTLYNKNYYAVLNAFGIKGRGPAMAELEFMEKWFHTYHFDLKVVLEACNRTIRQTHQPNFQYADKILKQWSDAHVSNCEDIARLDQEHKQQAKKQPDTPAAKTANHQNPSNRFNNFSQREYDYSALEQKLLNP